MYRITTNKAIFSNMIKVVGKYTIDNRNEFFLSHILYSLDSV